MFNSNEPIEVAHLQKLVNQSMLNIALVSKFACHCIFKVAGDQKLVVRERYS